MESRRVPHPCRSFTFDKAHTNSSTIYPDDLRTYICSTRGHVLDATMYSTRSGNASFDPALVGTIAIMAVVKQNWRGNRRADSRNEYIEVAPARLEPSPRSPARDLFYR